MGNNKNTGIIIAIILATVAVILGLVLYQKEQTNYPANTINSTTQKTVPTKKVLTVEQAEAYIGKTLKEFCAAYGDYTNVHPNEFSHKAGGGGVTCEEVGKGYWFDDYIVTQAYYYYDESSKQYYEEAIACKEDKSAYVRCKDPSVYVDTMPEDEAREAGIRRR